jgi:TIR domain
MPDSEYSVFITHASADEEIAIALKQYVERLCPGQEVFVSSDPEDLGPGDEWVAKILNALKSAKCILALTTERGLRRRWVWFEIGRTWFSGIKLIPCCLGKIRKGELPAPFSDRQALNIDEEEDASALFRSLRDQFKTNAVLPDLCDFVQTMVRLDVRAEERAKMLDDPYASEIMAGIERKAKSLSLAHRETIRLFAIHGELSTGAARVLSREAGVDMNQWSVPAHLVQITGWLIPRPGNTPYDEMEQNVYSVNQTLRPFLRAYFSRMTDCAPGPKS